MSWSKHDFIGFTGTYTIKVDLFVLFCFSRNENNDCIISHYMGTKLGRKGFIQLMLPHCCSSPKEVRIGTQVGQEAGADAEAMEGCSLLACLIWLAQLALL